MKKLLMIILVKLQSIEKQINRHNINDYLKQKIINSLKVMNDYLLNQLILNQF